MSLCGSSIQRNCQTSETCFSEGALLRQNFLHFHKKVTKDKLVIYFENQYVGQDKLVMYFENQYVGQTVAKICFTSPIFSHCLLASFPRHCHYNHLQNSFYFDNTATILIPRDIRRPYSANFPLKLQKVVLQLTDKRFNIAFSRSTNQLIYVSRCRPTIILKIFAVFFFRPRAQSSTRDARR